MIISSNVAPNHQISGALVVETFPAERRLKSDATKRLTLLASGLVGLLREWESASYAVVSNFVFGRRVRKLSGLFRKAKEV